MSFNESDARKFYGILGHHKIEYTELRAYDPPTKDMKDRRFVQGEDQFIEVCREWTGKYHVYAGLNPRKERKGDNEAVSRRTAILIDIDRHHGDSGATDADLEDAHNDLMKLLAYLENQGHPQPYVDMSGNGYHAIITVDIPSDATTTDRIKEFYRSLPVKTDEANADLARLCKVTGTMSLRGTPRLSYMVLPGEWKNDDTLTNFLTQGTPQSEHKAKTREKGSVQKVKDYMKRMRPCIRRMLNNDNPGAHGESGDLHHEAHLLIVKDAQYNGLGFEEICSLFVNQPDYKPEVTRKAVQSVIEDNIKKGITPWYCTNLISRGWCIAEDPDLCLSISRDPAEPKTKKETTEKGAELVKLAKENVVEFFRDQYRTGYATLYLGESVTAVTPVTDFCKSMPSESEMLLGKDLKTPVTAVTAVTKQTVPLNSKQFKWWLAQLYHKSTGETVGRDYIASATLVLEAETQSQSPRFLYNRFSPNGELSYWWDMGDDSGRAVHIDAGGWMIADDPPQVFRRYPHTLPIVEPKRGGSLVPFLDYLSLEEPGDKLLAIVSAISFMVPEVPHVQVVVTGRPGSGKSTFHRLLQVLIDPSGVDLLTLPTKDDDLVQVLDHHYLAIFDNVNQLTRTQSDILCRAITGAGNEKRELYTTDESFIRQFIRCIGMNGVSVPIEKSDLFSRSLLLQWVPVVVRFTDAEMKARMVSDAPLLVGAMLDVLSEAIRLYPSTKTKINVRMADFAKWGCAITRALGLDQGIFEKAYLSNLQSQDEEAVKASVVAEEIIRYMKVTNQVKITGSATELKGEIERWANPVDDRGHPMGDLLSRRAGWPKNAPAFGRELMEVAASLEVVGYRVYQTRSNKAREIVVEKIVKGGAPKEEKGQRQFETVSVEELTDTRLETALLDAAERFNVKVSV